MKKTGVLIVNTGTPSKLTVPAIKKYLKEFLSDKYVVSLPRIIWLPILYLFILPTRPQKMLKAYAKIWNYKKNESPLTTIIKSQTTKLSKKLGDDFIVDWTFRYAKSFADFDNSKNSITNKITKLQNSGCEKIIILPLFPQTCRATTGSISSVLYRHKTTQNDTKRHQLSIINGYFQHKNYIKALANNVKQHLNKTKSKNTKNQEEMPVILASFHGIPSFPQKQAVEYVRQCQQTVTLLQQKLCVEFSEKIQVKICYQSRFGPAKWLQPYTEETLKNLAKSGHKNVLIIAPGFASDCLETIEELGIRARKIFIKNGGKKFTLIPCLNDTTNSINMLTDIIKNHH